MNESSSTNLSIVSDAAAVGHSFEDACRIIVPITSEDFFANLLDPSEDVQYVAVPAVEKMLAEETKEQFLNCLLFITVSAAISFTYLPINQALIVFAICFILAAVQFKLQLNILRRTNDKTFFLLTTERAIAYTRSNLDNKHRAFELALADHLSAQVNERGGGLVDIKLNCVCQGHPRSLNFEGLPDDDWVRYLPKGTSIRRKKLHPALSMFLKIVRVLFKGLLFH